MNKRIAKKIGQAYFDGGEVTPYARYWTSYTSEQRVAAAVVNDRCMTRRAATVRAKRGWAKPATFGSRPVGTAMSSAKKGEYVWVQLLKP